MVRCITLSKPLRKCVSKLLLGAVMLCFSLVYLIQHTDVRGVHIVQWPDAHYFFQSLQHAKVVKDGPQQHQDGQ